MGISDEDSVNFWNEDGKLEFHAILVRHVWRVKTDAAWHTQWGV